MGKRRRLKTLEDCRRYAASLINRVEAKELESSEATKRAYLVQVLKSCIEASDIEKRIAELEERVGGSS